MGTGTRNAPVICQALGEAARLPVGSLGHRICRAIAVVHPKLRRMKSAWITSVPRQHCHPARVLFGAAIGPSAIFGPERGARLAGARCLPTMRSLDEA